MPLRTLLIFVLACTENPYDYSGGSGGGDDSGGDADADTDADSDSDTDVIPIDFSYDVLTDVVAYDSPMTVLATNATYDSLDVIDLGSRTTKARIALGDTPHRVKWDSANGLAYVVYGMEQQPPNPCESEIGCDNRVDVVDLATEKTIETITLTVGKTRYIATDVVLGRDGGIFVLADGDDWWSQETVVEVDATRAITVWPLEEDSEVNVVPLGYDGTSIYAEHWRFTFGTDPKNKTPLLVEANDYTPSAGWDSAPMHTALASDGTGILFPSPNKTVVELDPIKDGAWHEYELQQDISYGAVDMAYTHDETRVVTVGLEYDTYRLQVFDRASEKEVRSSDLGGIESISAETEILVVGSDDAYAWVYVYDSYTDKDEGKFLVTPLEL